MDAVAAGIGAGEEDDCAGLGRARREQRVGAGEPDTHRVDQRVAGVSVVELHFAADGRDAEAVAVAADAGDDVLEQIALARIVEAAEAQRIEQRDRPRAHREDVAHDAADARRRALVRLDADGWLCDSTFMTMHSPSPMSTAPAFSAPTDVRTRAPCEGKRRSSGRLFL